MSIFSFLKAPRMVNAEVRICDQNNFPISDCDIMLPAKGASYAALEWLSHNLAGIQKGHHLPAPVVRVVVDNEQILTLIINEKSL